MKVKKILKQLLDGYLVAITDNASVPYLVDNFFETYILTNYEYLKTKIEVYYLPLLEKYRISKTVDGEEIFKALISKDKNSNSPESLLSSIYKNLIITETTEEEDNSNVSNEAELWFDSLTEDEKINLNNKYEALELDDFSIPYADMKDSYQDYIKDIFTKEVNK